MKAIVLKKKTWKINSMGYISGIGVYIKGIALTLLSF